MTDRSVCLPLEQAIELAVKENIERDIRLGCIELCEQTLPISSVNCSVATYPSNIKQTYEEEARELFKTTGSNYNPEFPDHHFISVLK